MTRLFHMRAWLAIVLLVGAAVFVPGCRRQSRVLVPNRVLDRPLDVALACVIRRTDDTVESVSLNVCNGADGDNSPVCSAEDAPHLIGFVANSERNEVGMFRRCDRNGMVDLDPEAPGYNLVPVGKNPSRIVRTTDGCRAVTANWGSCDLSALDVPSLAHYAVELPIPVAPSSVVTTIVPRKSDGTPLAVRPGDLLAVPSDLSLAIGEDAGGGDGDTGGGADTGTGGSDTGDGETGTCTPDAPASVYVTFPGCQLVAEVSLVTQRILQSRQLVLADDGSIDVIDSGTDPSCPIECPAQFDGDVPPSELPDPDGVWPMALALVQPPSEEDITTPAQEEVDYAALFVGGTGSDELFEVRIDGRQWVDAAEVERLRLDEAHGVLAIRPTPAMTLLDGNHQFLYVVAGDGSTRVVDRNFDPSSLGIECDTQVDPTQTSASPCHPIDPLSQEDAPDRRPLAVGPGIRAHDGATITDWTFEEVRIEDLDDPQAQTRAPFGRVGVVGIGVTNFGRVVLGVFGQYQDAGSTVEAVDPVGLMNVEIRPHMLWPSVDPHSGDRAALPLVADEEPSRGLPDEDRPTQVLAPALRRIDLAYSDDAPEGEVSDQLTKIEEALNNAAGNVDQLGGYDDDAIYQEQAPRVAVRDYRQWRPGQAWELIWEGPIFATPSFSGRIACEEGSLGWEAATCKHSTAPAGDAEIRDDVRLIDESATFCDEGVLAGDKLVLQGCASDDACGLGQRCLRDISAASGASGICISEQKYEEELEVKRTICEPFIADPCGDRHREYVVLAAKQTELWIAPMDIPPRSYVRSSPAIGPGCPDEVDCPAEQADCPVECEARLTCLTPAAPTQPAGGCTADDQCDGVEVDDDGDGSPDDYECAFGRCRKAAQAGQCRADDECDPIEVDHDGDGLVDADYVCIEGLCRTGCEPGSPECLLAPMPGPECFAELVRYDVRVRNAFTFGTPNGGAPFYADRVVPDEAGYCRVDATVSTLLQSRIPLGADEDETFSDPQTGIPVCPNAAEAGPTDPNPCRITLTREQAADTPFHAFSYKEEPVSAIRFSNPYMSIVLDLTSLLDLARPAADFDDVPWPESFAEFTRSRIPRNYRETFDIGDTGYQPYNDVISVTSTPLTYPVRVVPAPEIGAAFVVDNSGRGGATGVRGQIVRIFFDGTAIAGDQEFLVR